MPAAYLQVRFRIDFSMEANNMDQDQTTPCILFAVKATSENKLTRADNKSVPCRRRIKMYVMMLI